MTFIALTAVSSFSESSPAQPGKSGKSKVPETTKPQMVEAYGRLPLRFEANQGQADSRVKFLSRGSNHTLFLTPTETALQLTAQGGSRPLDGDCRLSNEECDSNNTQSAILRMRADWVTPLKLAVACKPKLRTC